MRVTTRPLCSPRAAWLSTTILLTASCESAPVATNDVPSAEPAVIRETPPSEPPRENVETVPNWTAALSLSKPEQLHSFDDQRATALTFEPGGHKLFAASGNVVTEFSPEPKVRWEDARFRKHLGAAPNGVLLLDDQARDSEGESRAKPELGPGYEIREACGTLDGKFVALRIGWRPPRGRPVRGPDGEPSYEYSRPNEASGPDEYFEVLDARTNARVLRVDARYTNFACSRQHIAVAMADQDGSTRVALVDPEAQETRVLDHGDGAPAPPGTVAFSPDGSVLARVSWTGEITTWVPPNHRLLGTGSLGEGFATASVAVHPSGTVMVGLKDGRMLLVNPENMEVAHTWTIPELEDLQPFQRTVSSAAFSDDGKRLATAHGGVGSNIRIWNVSKNDRGH